jgi:hypothetical protein
MKFKVAGYRMGQQGAALDRMLKGERIGFGAPQDNDEACFTVIEVMQYPARAQASHPVHLRGSFEELTFELGPFAGFRSCSDDAHQHAGGAEAS